MITVLLLFTLAAHEHKPPEYPKFFSVYRTEQACQEAAKRYMSLNGKVDFLINAKCEDARNPSLVPYLQNVPEIEALQTEVPPQEYK